jgi:purine catabolism regulator
MITMRETLSIPELQNAMVLTGKSGLNRKIRWVHVIDTDDVGHFLEGGEFLLTSGQLWPQTKESEERLLKSFIRNQISGILFATGRYLTECPPAVLEFGEKNAIPVIAVPFHVPFVKITQRIHQEIMNRHYKKIELTTRLPFELKENLQSTNSQLDICKILAEHLKCSIAVTDTANQIYLKASPRYGSRINIQKYINDLINDCQHLNQMIENVQSFYLPTKTPPYAIAVPMKVGGNIWGTLWLVSLDQELKEEQAHILEYAATLLIDLVLNNQDLEVKSRRLRIELLELLLENPKTASVIIEEKIQELGLEYRANWLAGLIILGDNKLSSPSPLSMEMEVMRDECKKWIDQTEGVNGFCEIYEGQLVLFISSSLDNFQLKHQFNNLQNNLRNMNTEETAPVLVFGEIKQHALSLIESYQEAKALAPIVQHQSHSGGTYFSDQLKREMFLYGGLTPQKAMEFRNIILPKELLTEQGSTLYETLKCLASNNYNRDKVTKCLHIHLNTLRYRIKRIEHLLEDSLTSLKCQFWIQVALDLESLATEFEESNL